MHAACGSLSFLNMHINNFIVINIVNFITGWSSRRTFCSSCHTSGRSVALLADAETSASRTVQTDSDLAGTAGTGYPAMDRQLRTSVRFYLWLLGGLCADAVYLIWSLRS